MVTGLRACSSSDTGFIVNSVHVKGAVIAYGQIWMMWKVAKLQDVTPESLALLQLIKPVPDLLVFGSGSTQQRPPKEALLALRDLNIGLEALPTVRFAEICNRCDFCRGYVSADTALSCALHVTRVHAGLCVAPV